MERLKTYNLKLVTFVIGGRDISSYGEDGGLSLEPFGERSIPKVGATGAAVASVTNNFAGILTVTVGEWTQAYKDLAELMQLQEAQLEIGPYIPLNVLVRDPLNGDKFKDEYAAFTTHPGVEKMMEAGEREFAIFMPNVYNRANCNFGGGLSGLSFPNII